MDDFLGKANLMLKRILHAITLDECSYIEHFMKKDVYNELLTRIEKDKSLHRREIFDEVNVSSSILRVNTTTDEEQIEVLFSIKSLHYYENIDTKEISGVSNKRGEFSLKVLFSKKRLAEKNEGRCLGCGATIDYYHNGICPHCSRTYDLELFDYVIEEMDW